MCDNNVHFEGGLDRIKNNLSGKLSDEVDEDKKPDETKNNNMSTGEGDKTERNLSQTEEKSLQTVQGEPVDDNKKAVAKVTDVNKKDGSNSKIADKETGKKYTSKKRKRFWGCQYIIYHLTII